MCSLVKNLQFVSLGEDDSRSTIRYERPENSYTEHRLAKHRAKLSSMKHRESVRAGGEGGGRGGGGGGGAKEGGGEMEGDGEMERYMMGWAI